MFGSVCHVVSVVTTHLCLCSVKQHKPQANECVSIKLYSPKHSRLNLAQVLSSADPFP